MEEKGKALTIFVDYVVENPKDLRKEIMWRKDYTA